MSLLPSATPRRPAPNPLAARHRVGFVLLALLSGLATTHYNRPVEAAPPENVGVLPPPALRAASPDVLPLFTRTWVSPAAHTPSAHSSAVCTLPSGDLLAVWYGGSREGGKDVALYTARLPAGATRWSRPVRTIDRELAQAELDRVIKKVGNAVVFPDRNGLVWLVYVTVSVGGWSGSAINVKISRDEGRTWGESQRLNCNPFLNLSSLVRNKPIYADDGRIGLPVYHEMATKFPQILWLTPGQDGTLVDYRIRNLGHAPDLIQPSLVPVGGNRVLMLLRDGGENRVLHIAHSHDNGWTWTEPEPTSLPNPDAAVDALRLRDGRILLAYNHAAQGRDNLQLAVSADDGRTWRAGPVIEAAANEEFSYPNLAEDHHGRIHLTYTWKRERIRHAVFNVAWFDGPTLAQHGGGR